MQGPNSHQTTDRGRDDARVSSFEYGLLLAMIATMIIGVIALLGQGMDGAFERPDDLADQVTRADRTS